MIAPTPPAPIRPTSTRPAPPSPVRFVKGHGARNDFVLIEDHEGREDLTPERVAVIAECTRGLGADGVIRVVRTRSAGIEAPADAPDWFMDYRNADGSIAEMCGNGVRVLAAHLLREGLVSGPVLRVWTRAGEREVEVLEQPAADGPARWMLRVGMGPARPVGDRRRVRVAGRELETLDVSVGNPHTVAHLPADLALADLDLTHRPALDPEPEGGTNIELVEDRGERHVAMRVVERGVGETLACGTGAVAVAVAAAARAGDTTGRPWRVDLPGGTLTVGWMEDGTTTLAGPAEIVAEGTLLL